MSKYPNSGIFFYTPPSKKTNPKQPDYNGKLDIGVDLLQHLVSLHQQGKDLTVDLSGWRKEGAKGPFLSLAVRPAWEKGQSSGQSHRSNEPPPGFGADLDDEIPF